MKALLVATLLFAAPAQVAGQTRQVPQAAPIAVIVHEDVPVDEVSLPELRRIFRGERLFWAGDMTITLLAPPRGSRERQVLLGKVYERRSEAEYKRFWINKLFDKRGQTAPKITGSPKMSASLVREIPGAIALVPADRIPRGVKVLRIDGRSPGEEGYPLL
jgi:ABC-type phosphate transport system substrate-binding protein